MYGAIRTASTLEILFTTVKNDKSADGCQSRCSDIARLNRTGEPQSCGCRKQSWIDDFEGEYPS